MPRLSLTRAAALVLALAVSGCHASSPGKRPADGVIPVVTTISTFNSFVQGVGGSHVSVQSLVPIGASPETYQPTPQNVATLANAHLLVENGAGLESWLDRSIANAGSKSLRIVVGTDGLPVKNQNPHLWMDPQYAKHYVAQIRDALVRLDPKNAGDYRHNAAHYTAELDALTKQIAQRYARVSAERRYMIVFHNAWQYYNDRFGITTLGFIEANPGQDPNPHEIGRLIDLAKQHHLNAVFSEPEYSPKLAQQIAHDAGIRIVDNLYDDSLGTDRSNENYIAMIAHDTDIILKSMQ